MTNSSSQQKSPNRRFFGKIGIIKQEYGKFFGS